MKFSAFFFGQVRRSSIYVTFFNIALLAVLAALFWVQKNIVNYGSDQKIEDYLGSPVLSVFTDNKLSELIARLTDGIIFGVVAAVIVIGFSLFFAAYTSFRNERLLHDYTISETESEGVHWSRYILLTIFKIVFIAGVAVALLMIIFSYLPATLQALRQLIFTPELSVAINFALAYLILFLFELVAIILATFYRNTAKN